MDKRIAVVRGDYSSPEVITQTLRVLQAVADKYEHKFEFVDACVGGEALDKFGEPLPKTEFDKCIVSDAVLMGSIGGPKWKEFTGDKRPETALEKLRIGMGLFTNMKYAKLWSQISTLSPLKEQIVGKGVDYLIIRELSGGIYYGKHDTVQLDSGMEYAYDIMQYDSKEIERIGKIAFSFAMKRRKRVCLVGKPDVLDTSRLWLKITTEVSKEFPDVIFTDMSVENCATLLNKNPAQFDVILTENMFGEVLGAQASVNAGSLGMVPSCSIDEKHFGLFGMTQGSAPELAGKDTVNPLASVLSTALMLKYCFDMKKEAEDVERAVERVLDRGYRTPDIMSEGYMLVSTRGMGDALVAEITGESEAKFFEAVKEVEKIMGSSSSPKEKAEQAAKEQQENAEAAETAETSEDSPSEAPAEQENNS